VLPSRSSNARHEGAILGVQDPAYRWQGRNEHRSNVTASQAARYNDKHSCAACSQSGNLERTIPQTRVFREDDPVLLSNRGQPDTILFIGLEVVVVDFQQLSQL
jgi:hypothetical protein